MFAAGVLAAGTTAFAQSVAPAGGAPAEGEVVEGEKYVITGSRVQRVDTEAVSPVVQLSFTDVKKLGFTTVGDALRSLSFNSGQALTPADSGNSFTPGISTVNLRGLGNNSTLVLINGRRAVPYASPGFNGLQTMFDTESIPQAAIRSVEILKDGSSAIYGSDAVAGVIDFKLRDDFDGTTLSVEGGNYFGTDGLHRQASIVTGAESAKTTIIVTADWRERKSVFNRDLDWAHNADNSYRAYQAEPRYTATGWEGAGFGSEAEYLEFLEAYDPVADGQFDLRSSRGFPGYVRYDVDGDDTIENATERFTYRTPTNSPTVAGAVNGYNAYNFNSMQGAFPDTENFSVYTRARHAFTEFLYGFTELSFSRSSALTYAAETPADIETENGLTTGDAMMLPSYNAFNPFGVDITDGRRRMVEVGNRINDVRSDTPRLLAGLGGDFPGGGDWSWEAAALYTKSTVDKLNRGAVADYRLQQALMGLTRESDGSLTWNPATPVGNRVYFNWFGLNGADMTKYITVIDPESSELEYTSYDASVRGTVWQLPGGPLGVAFGAERRQEDFANIRSDLAATANVVGGGEGTSAEGQRTVTSFYAEAVLPVVKMLELQLAARYEDYSDKGFKDEARPKAGLKFRPLPWLVFRGSYSESFKAPDLAYLYTGSQTSFSSFQVNDPVTGTRIDQLKIVTAGNLKLQAEETDSYYGGIALEPGGRWRGLQISADWFEFKQDQLLAQLSDFYGYAEFLTKAAGGDPLFADKVVRDPASGEVLFIRDDYVNISKARYRGVDFAVGYDWTHEQLGRFYVGASATWLDSFTIDGDETVGSWLMAEWNGTSTLSWSRGDWAVNAYGVYRGERNRELSFGSIFDQGDELFLAYRVKSQTTWNASVSYAGFWDVNVTVGVNNLFNKEPPVDPYETIGTTAGINDPEPPFYYVRLERTF